MTDTNRRTFLKTTALGAASLPFLKVMPALAEGRDTLVVVSGQTINSLDLHRVGTNRASYQVAINCYDRLVSFGTKTLPTGELSYDYENIVPELAESWSLSDDGLVITFKPVPFIINAEVAKANATADDPWAMEYLHQTPAGSGAFKVARWDQGQQLVYERNDDWVGGPVPAVQRVIVREVPSQSTRRALIERGDVQVSFDIPDRDAAELADKMTVHSTPIENCIHCACLNTNFEPFQDANVRKAIAWAIPYEAIFNTAAYGRGAPMWGGPETVTDTQWPRPFPYTTNLDTAREFLAKSNYADGFSVPLSISLDLAAWMEPTALLIQESLEKIGITCTVEKIPGANWRTVALVDKSLAFHLENFGGWLNTPDYYFFWAYQKDKLFNSSNYYNEEVEELTNRTLHMPMDHPEYAGLIQRMFEIVMDDIPRIPLWQPALNVALNGATDYEFWFHRQLDARPIAGV